MVKSIPGVVSPGILRSRHEARVAEMRRQGQEMALVKRLVGNNSEERSRSLGELRRLGGVCIEALNWLYKIVRESYIESHWCPRGLVVEHTVHFRGRSYDHCMGEIIEAISFLRPCAERMAEVDGRGIDPWVAEHTVFVGGRPVRVAWGNVPGFAPLVTAIVRE